MVNMIALSPTPIGTNNSGDVNALVEMHTAMDELRHHNQTLEDDVHNIGQHQKDSNPQEDMELFDP